MLDLKHIVKDFDAAAAALAKRGESASDALAALVALNEQRKELTSRHNGLRHEQKTLSKGFGKGPKEEMATLREQLKTMSTAVKELDLELKDVEARLDAQLLNMPNLPHDSVPAGKSEDDNELVRSWGRPRTLGFEGVEHDVLGERLGMLDFEAAARVSGSGFVLYKGLGARFERALASFMLDLHTDAHGYEELLTPFLVRREAMVGTGQLPKFEEDAFCTQPDDLFLIPTAEVPVTNMYRGTILDPAQVPMRFAAFSPCFRREAGGYGRAARGLTRTHQFQKVEMVQFVRPEDSADAHEALTGHAEAVLQALDLPYRVMNLCGGDLGFSASKCYDLEVWLPVQDRFREISSCSNFGDFQARRANIRFRPAAGEKPKFVHTINGSGLAIGRTLMAIIENYQNADGSLTVPEVLRPYMRVDVIR